METAGNAQGTTTNTTGASGGAGGGAQGGTQDTSGGAQGGASALVTAADAAEKAKGAADAAKGDATKTDAAKNAAPPPLELKLPEGLDAKNPSVAPALENIRGLAKEAGLSAEQAQKVADTYFKAQAPLLAAQAQLEAERKAWPAELRADKEIGGANFDASMKLAGQALSQFGGKELAKLMQEHGLGDNPVLVKFCVRVGKALGEDSAAGTTADGPVIRDAEAKLRARYPSMDKG